MMKILFLLNNNYSEAIEFDNKPLPEYKIKNIEEYLNSWLQRLIFNNLSNDRSDYIITDVQK